MHLTVSRKDKKVSRGAPTIQVIWSFTINSEGQDTMIVLTDGGIPGGVIGTYREGYGTHNKGLWYTENII